MVRKRGLSGGILGLVIGLIMSVPGFSQSAGQKSVAIEVSATVLPEIELTTIRDIDLREMEITGDLIHVSPIMDPAAGLMLARGLPNAQIRLTFLKELEMLRTDGPGQLFLSYEVSTFKEDNQRASKLFQTIDDELRLNENGQIYIWVGALIDLSNAQPGNYEGEFTVELEYL